MPDWADPLVAFLGGLATGKLIILGMARWAFGGTRHAHLLWTAAVVVTFATYLFVRA